MMREKVLFMVAGPMAVVLAIAAPTSYNGWLVYLLAHDTVPEPRLEIDYDILGPPTGGTGKRSVPLALPSKGY